MFSRVFSRENVDVSDGKRWMFSGVFSMENTRPGEQCFPFSTPPFRGVGNGKRLASHWKTKT